MKFKLEIDKVLQELLLQEDTDGDKKITKEDKGPKQFKISNIDGDAYEVSGTYHLSNLLQELALAKNKNLEYAEFSCEQIIELPATRISRTIREVFWDDLTRSVDEKGIAAIVSDAKTETTVNRIYVPFTDEYAQNYFKKIGEKYNIAVVVLPENITPEYVRSINDKPGILSLKIENDSGVPFVVPGGRFNEMYGWDSYFEGIGLILDGRVDLAKAMVDNFCYQIIHYGKILNANRSYYLTRTQPPFLSSFIREVYEADQSIEKLWLEQVLEIAIKEYESVWMQKGKRLSANGLNRYLAEGIGIPPETESGHFDEVLKKYAAQHNTSIANFIKKYQSEEIEELELNEYFVHDRSLRESGHDTSWRLDGICADLNTVDLNALLYKYETDFAHLIETYFCGDFKRDGTSLTTEYWTNKALQRKKLMNEFLWSDSHNSFYDFNLKSKKVMNFDSASNFYPLWAKSCSAEQASVMVTVLMRELKVKGGIVGTSKKAIAKFDNEKVQRQWDYPNGWAPHQMLLWKGLLNYGYKKEADECIYRWLWMISRNAVDYNGTIPEKYNVVTCTHKVYAEYGNVGTEFDYITTSGFGWMNASYQFGLSLLSPELLLQLNDLIDPDVIFK